MTEITWGREIPVDGKRPAWLADAIAVKWRNDHGDWHKTSTSTLQWDWNVTAIRLLADHFAYTALDKGYVPWGGDKEAPADWDGGQVLLCDGEVANPPFFGRLRWTHNQTVSVYENADIIGYRKRATPSADTAAVKRLTEADCREARNAYFDDNGGDDSAVFYARRLGLLREETLAERYTRETGKEATPEVIAAIEWAEARHG